MDQLRKDIIERDAKIRKLTVQVRSQEDELIYTKYQLKKYIGVLAYPDWPLIGPIEQNERLRMEQVCNRGPDLPLFTSLKDLEEYAKKGEEIGSRQSKSKETEETLKRAFLNNDLLKKFNLFEIKEILNEMSSITHPEDVAIYRRGDVDNLIYVLESGLAEVTDDSGIICKIKPGSVICSDAVIHQCTRSETVKAVSECVCWVIQRNKLRQATQRADIKRKVRNAEHFKNLVTDLHLPERTLLDLADLSSEVYYKPGQYIIRQGKYCNTLYIICEGYVKETLRKSPSDEEELVREFPQKSYFGEIYMYEYIETTSSIVAGDSGATCIQIDRKTFQSVMDKNRKLWLAKLVDNKRRSEINNPFSNILLQDFNYVDTLGCGSYGHVNLVHMSNDNTKSFALKKMAKKKINDKNAGQHIIEEKELLLSINCDFVARAFKTFKDSKYVYLLMEACLGGSLDSILYNRNKFDENTARFYLACVVEAFSYLHLRDILYGDLKPGNIVLDNKGYAKLVDFGFSKKLEPGCLNSNMHGTANYISPESILGRGHGIPANYWALGILLYEFLMGVPPFGSGNSEDCFRRILEGIDDELINASISKSSKFFIKELCMLHPQDRLGHGQDDLNGIRCHEYYRGFDWEKLQARTMKAPIQPKVESAIDASNFDYVPTIGSYGQPNLSVWFDKFF